MYKFKILETLSKNPDLSQKALSIECDISIGKINYTLGNLTEEGLIETIKLGKSYRYSVTDKGRDFIRKQLEELHDTKVTIYSRPKTQVKQAVILAGGEKTEFEKPVGLLEIEQGKTLLERNIEILEANGIERIVIVVGYKKEAFEEVAFKNKDNIFFAENAKYSWTGSMASLAKASEFITEDFFLIEDDILIEENAIKRVLDSEDRDCVLVTKESGSGDEAFIEIKNGYLYKISKDLHQLNRIDGEMIGVSKISHDVFMEMLDLFKENKNPYVNYEYLLLDVSRKINVGYLKISELIWSEIDNQNHYFKVVDKFYPMLRRKEQEFRELELKESISNALNIDVDLITEVKPFGGMTNKNYKVTINEEEFVVRVSGNGTEDMINRIEEKLNSQLASSIGINPEQLYFNEKTGLKIARLIPDAETFNAKTARREENLIKVANILKTLHQSDLVMENVFNVFETMEQYERLVVKAKGTFFEGYSEVKQQVSVLKDFYHGLNIELTPCHNDTVPENFVKSGDDKLYLIDWEYSGMNDPLWDLAAFSLESELLPLEETLLLLEYFDGTVSIEHRQRVLLNKIFQDFVWSIWTILKEAKGDDFGSYGINRFNRAIRNIDEFNHLYQEAGEVEKV